MNNRLDKCPICDMKTFDYSRYFDEAWGAMMIVEQHGYCSSCGFTVEQAYSDVYEAFSDRAKGYQIPGGKYLKKDVKRHKRHRRIHKDKCKGIEVNPIWVNYI